MQLTADVTAPDATDTAYARRRLFLSIFFLIMCAFRDAIFVTGPIFVFRLEGSVKSGGLYGTSLLFGGMLSFLVMGAVVDRLGWRRVAIGAAATLVLANAVLAATALKLLPYQRETDIVVLTSIFFCGSAFYLIPDVLINRLLHEDDRPAAYSRSGSLFPAIALMITSALLFGLERAFGDLGLGLTLAIAALLAMLSLPLIGGLRDPEERTSSHEAPPGGVSGVVLEWLSGFRLIASNSTMRFLLVFNCCVALALAPHNVFVTAILKSVFGLDDGGVAVAQFALATVEVLAALAFPSFAKAQSLRVLAMTAIVALVGGNGLAALVLRHAAGEAARGGLELALYVTAHVAVFVGLTFAMAWIRVVRGKATPLPLLGRTAGAMSVVSQLCSLTFSLAVTFTGGAVAAHVFYAFCVAVTALVGAPMALSVARRVGI